MKPYFPICVKCPLFRITNSSKSNPLVGIGCALKNCGVNFYHYNMYDRKFNDFKGCDDVPFYCNFQLEQLVVQQDTELMKGNKEFLENFVVKILN